MSVVVFVCPRDCCVLYDFVPPAIPSSQDTIYKYNLFLLHKFVPRSVRNKRTFTAVSKRSQYSSASIVTRLLTKLRCHSSFPGRGKSFVSCSAQPDWLWGLPNLLPAGYQGQGGWDMQLTWLPHLMPRWRVRKALLINLICILAYIHTHTAI